MDLARLTFISVITIIERIIEGQHYLTVFELIDRLKITYKYFFSCSTCENNCYYFRNYYNYNTMAKPAPKGGKGKSGDEIFSGFQNLRTEQRQLANKISELEMDLNEHK